MPGSQSHGLKAHERERALMDVDTHKNDAHVTVPADLAPLTVPEVKRLLEIVLPLPVRSPLARLAWSFWRRKKRQQARRSHYRRTARFRTDLKSKPLLRLQY